MNRISSAAGCVYDETVVLVVVVARRREKEDEECVRVCTYINHTKI